MAYKNPRHAFLFEAIIGLVSLVLIVSVGRLGIISLAFLALRPFLLERESDPPTEQRWRLYYNAFRMSLLLTGIAIILTYAGLELDVVRVQHPRLIFVLILSWFLIAHGFSGFILSSKTR